VVAGLGPPPELYHESEDELPEQGPVMGPQLPHHMTFQEQVRSGWGGAVQPGCALPVRWLLRSMASWLRKAAVCASSPGLVTPACRLACSLACSESPPGVAVP
jgi:hypothetical protein